MTMTIEINLESVKMDQRVKGDLVRKLFPGTQADTQRANCSTWTTKVVSKNLVRRKNTKRQSS